MVMCVGNPKEFMNSLLKQITEFKQGCRIYDQNAKVNLCFYITVTNYTK